VCCKFAILTEKDMIFEDMGGDPERENSNKPFLA